MHVMYLYIFIRTKRRQIIFVKLPNFQKKCFKDSFRVQYENNRQFQNYLEHMEN